MIEVTSRQTMSPEELNTGDSLLNLTTGELGVLTTERVWIEGSLVGIQVRIIGTGERVNLTEEDYQYWKLITLTAIETG